MVGKHQRMAGHTSLRGSEDMNKKKARKDPDALVDAFADAIIGRIGGMVEESVKEHLTDLEKRILERLPEVVHIPPHPVDAPRERLMPLREVAEVLGCSEDTVKSRMAAGQLAWITEQGTKERKVPYSWLLEYIHGHTRYTGSFHQRRELPDSEGIGAASAAIVKESKLRRVS